MPLHSYPTLNVDHKRQENAEGSREPVASVLAQAQPHGHNPHSFQWALPTGMRNVMRDE